MLFPKTVQLAIAAFALALSLAPLTTLPAAAQDMNATVIVPDAPGGARFTGCYSIAQRLYGPYRMDFCLEQRGSYNVRGGGVVCDGRLDWSASGRNINIDLRKSSCGNGVAWSADSMVCQGTTLFGGGIKGAIGNALAKVIVPNVPTLTGLSCTYYPDARGKSPTQITARRTN
jgi:hypothetical protein